MQVVDRAVFEEDMKIGGESLAYSGFLHICILAMGYKYADTTRPDIQRLSLGNKESTLHKEAKYLVEYEFEKPGGIPSVQALLILGQIETGCGRDAIGWMYAGMISSNVFNGFCFQHGLATKTGIVAFLTLVVRPCVPVCLGHWAQP